MTKIQLVNNFTNSVADIPEVAYVAPTSNDALITSFTAANTSSQTTSYKAYIVNSGDVAISPQKPMQFVVWGEIDLGIGIVGQVIPKGGSLQIESGNPDKIKVTVTGDLI